MATDDRQILVTGSAPTPASFLVPGNGQVRPKEIFATFDGTGAGGTFTPALKIISDAGKTVGIHPTDSNVAAGASADVSWFPRVGTAAVSGSSAGATTTIFHQQLTAPAATLGTPANTIPSTFAHFQLIARLRTTAATINDIAAITMNGDAAAHYDRASITWNGAAIAFSSTYATTGMVLDCLGANADANRFGTIQALFVDYNDTSSFKNAQAGGAEIGAAADADVRISLLTDWTWKTTASINQVTLTPLTGGANFATGSSLTLYGIPPIAGT